MCNQAADNYRDALEYVPGCFKSQEMCDKVADIHCSLIQFLSESGWAF